MREFKFACPVCEQHITAAAGTSGTQIQCPTCFQKIIVPQEPADDTKLILHAAMADKPRPPQTLLDQQASAPPRASSKPWMWVAAVVVLMAAVAAVLYSRERKPIDQNRMSQQKTNLVNAAPAPAATTSRLWTLDSKKAVAPDEPVTGMLNGQSFTLTRAWLQGGALVFRQGKGSPPELALTINFPAKRGEDLAGKKAVVAAGQAPPVPKVVMRWKKPDGKTSTKTFASGYVMRLELEALQEGKIPGRVFIALPDDQKSVLAGTFSAELRAPVPPKPKTPKQKKQVTTTPN